MTPSDLGSSSNDRGPVNATPDLIRRFEQAWVAADGGHPLSAEEFWQSLPARERTGLSTQQQANTLDALRLAESRLRQYTRDAMPPPEARRASVETQPMKGGIESEMVDASQRFPGEPPGATVPLRDDGGETTVLPRSGDDEDGSTRVFRQENIADGDASDEGGFTLNRARDPVAFTWDPNAGDDPMRRTVAGAPLIAGYEVIRELGRGGMGVVYHARHRGLKRDVALKMILGGSHSSPEQLERFRAEAEAVARLRHPNIVQIYDVGEQEGMPYFSLEFVDGPTLDKKIGGTPQLQTEAARVVQALADAMQYAHERAIVHRDLKPGNILISAEGTPKITDFGLVKRLDDQESSRTQAGMILGTPSYMAPEQGRSDPNVGPLADVYALGAILYTVLTGRPPFLAITPMDTVLQLLNAEPVPPSRLQPKIARDIETICLKALQKEPAKRYATAGLLAEDLRRFLGGEAILARPVGHTERMVRWCRRNRLVAALMAVALALALTVLVGTPIAAIRIALERNDAIHARDDARVAQGHAEQSAAIARNERQRAGTQAEIADKQRQLAIGALGTLVNRVQDQLQDTARTHHLKQDLLKTAFEGLRQVQEASLEGSAQVEQADSTIAEAHQRMGRIFLELGHADAARNECQTAFEILDHLGAADPDNPQLQYDLSRAAMQLSDALLLLGDVEQARGFSLRALTARRNLAKAHPIPAVYRNLAKAYVQLGNVERDRDQTGPAKDHFSKALQIQEQLLASAADADRFDQKQDLRMTLDTLGDLHLIWLNDPQQAKKHYARALDIARELIESDAQSVRNRQTLAIHLEKLGNANKKLGDDPAAQNCYAQALPGLEQLALEDPEALLVQGELAMVLARFGRHAEAAEKARGLWDSSPDYARNLYNVACCFSLCASGVAGNGAPDDPETEALQGQYLRQAVDALRAWSAIEARPGTKAHYLAIDPDLEALREDPEFRELVSQLSAPR